MLYQSVAVAFNDQGVLMEHMMRVRCTLGSSYIGMIGKCTIIKVSSTSSCSDIFIEVLQLYTEHCSLYGVEPRINSNQIMIVANFLSVIGDHAQLFCHCIIVGEK